LNGEKTPEERAGLLVWHLAHGDAFRTRDAAAMTGLSRSAAWALLCRISGWIPIYETDDGRWQVLTMQEAEETGAQSRGPDGRWTREGR
jgi:hypothetical protein